MYQFAWLRRQVSVHRSFAARITALIVAAHGIFILANTLLDQLSVHRGAHLNLAVIDLPLLVGLSLLYLSTLLRRRKYTAWMASIAVYTFYLGLALSDLAHRMNGSNIELNDVIRGVVLPLGVLALLIIVRREFTVRSDTEGFRWAAQFAVFVMLAALVYGTVGFTLFDRTDFHEEIGPAAALHYTIDQFGLTTNHLVHPYTRRAQVFVDSLSFVSTAAVLYAVLSLFQPIRLRLSDQTGGRTKLANLLNEYGAKSEDFFKVWPHDKSYFFDPLEQAGLAYHTTRGVALCLGDPVGEPRQFRSLMTSFSALCYGNDWLPAFVHIEDKHRQLYEQFDFSLQRIGQEAVVDIDHFQTQVVNNKYFRNIKNKFNKQGYTCEYLAAPHHDAVIHRLKAISDEWLEGGKAERGFAMGSFDAAYLQQCGLMVIRDAAGTIQGFLNHVPAPFDRHEATYDMLRQTKQSLSNTLDFLMMHFMATAAEHGYKSVNLGLCPLAGLDEDDPERGGLVDNVLQFFYNNGERFYSFSGLERFKSKYEPEWRDRYVAYQGGVRGFSRTMTALVRTMRIKSR